MFVLSNQPSHNSHTPEWTGIVRSYSSHPRPSSGETSWCSDKDWELKTWQDLVSVTKLIKHHKRKGLAIPRPLKREHIEKFNFWTNQVGYNKKRLEIYIFISLICPMTYEKFLPLLILWVWRGLQVIFCLISWTMKCCSELY